MADCHPLTSPMVVRTLSMDTNPFRPNMDDEDVLGPEISYLSAIGALMYLTTHTRPDIAFAVNLLSRFSSYCGILECKEPTIIFEDNAACIAQLKDGYIKGDRTKHILPKFFFTHDLQKNGEVKVIQVRSSDNSADLFTKALLTCTFRKLTHQIGMRRLKDLH
ncbi:uncharacterized protein LOC125583019 [Brassica napus]|uniref:uncharacterized protein LOC125583019 n=1 Tax=Brassica napus TaxID=3708 RepID=UPI002078CBCF|nr:uncharacterized protein LOC125583019 [Brassica napus]